MKFCLSILSILYFDFVNKRMINILLKVQKPQNYFNFYRKEWQILLKILLRLLEAGFADSHHDSALVGITG